MSLTGVQEYLRVGMDGLPTPQTNPIKAWVFPPPIVQTTDEPQMFIWAAALTESRMTMPRGKGQKMARYPVSLTLQYATPPDPDEPQSFPSVIDAVRAYLRSIELPAEVTDPVTGEVTWLVNIGETISVTYPTPIATTEQGYLAHRAVFRLPVSELMKGA